MKLNHNTAQMILIQPEVIRSVMSFTLLAFPMQVYLKEETIKQNTTRLHLECEGFVL